MSQESAAIEAPARIKFKPTLISKSKVRQFILAYCNKTRPTQGFTRVGDDVYFDLEETLKRRMRDLVDRHPSRGKTINMG